MSVECKKNRTKVKVSDGCRLSVLRQRQYADEATANKNKPITLWRPDSPGYKAWLYLLIGI